LEFIQRYGGDPDAEGDSWAEVQQEMVDRIGNWKMDELVEKVAEYKDEWAETIRDGWQRIRLLISAI
jgi:hypothetical protein